MIETKIVEDIEIGHLTEIVSAMRGRVPDVMVTIVIIIGMTQ